MSDLSEFHASTFCLNKPYSGDFLRDLLVVPKAGLIHLSFQIFDAGFQIFQFEEIDSVLDLFLEGFEFFFIVMHSVGSIWDSEFGGEIFLSVLKF